MKKTLLVLLAVAFYQFGATQTIFSEDFQDVSDIQMYFGNPDDLNDDDPEEASLWVNFDFDEILDNNGDTSDWYLAIGPEHTFIDGTTNAFIPLDGIEDTVEVEGVDYPWLVLDGAEDTNLVFGSNSWLQNYAEGNRNWLILPRMDIPDGASLSWKSSTAQGPRYSDGYKVLITVGEVGALDDYEELFSVAQCVPPVPGSSTTGPDALDLSQGTVFHDTEGGYIPYNGFDTTAYLGVYFHLGGQAYDDASSFRGMLEPFSIDLSDYEGESVRIAFLHDSDDDVAMDIDDILIQGANSVSENTADFFDIYPNPAVENLTLSLTDKVQQAGVYRIMGQKGELVASGRFAGNNARNQEVSVAHLSAGTYTFQIILNGKEAYATQFIKK